MVLYGFSPQEKGARNSIRGWQVWMNLHESQRGCICLFEPQNPPIKSTLPETNSSPLKMDGWKLEDKFPGARPICRGELFILGMAYAIFTPRMTLQATCFSSKVEFFQVEIQSVFEAIRWMDTLISEETNQGIRIYLSLHLGYDIDMTFVCFWQRSQDHQRCLYDNSFLINSVSSTGKDSTKQHGSALPADEDPRQGPG